MSLPFPKKFQNHRDGTACTVYYPDDEDLYWHDFNQDGCTAIVGAPAPHTLLDRAL